MVKLSSMEMVPEVRKRLEDLLKLRASTVDAIKGSEEYKDTLNEEIEGVLVRVKPVVVSGPFEGVDVESLWLTARLETKPTSTLSKEKLLELGVSADIIAKATIKTESKPFVSVRKMAKKNG